MIKIAFPSQLKQKGLLSMNARNIEYISAFNARKRYPSVDNKLKTKRLAEKANIAVPKLLEVIATQHQVSRIEKTLQPYSNFVIKPAKGSAGKGILVIVGKENQQFIQVSGLPISLEEIKRHSSNILSGLYSLGGQTDVAMVEQLVNFNPIFEQYSYKGAPDIRVIIFKGYPVMAMIRLSTKASDGKANLHQGAVGVGINITTGKAVNAVQFDQKITSHPDTKAELSQLCVPHWHELLCLAASYYEVTKLGYIGADIVLDNELGPLILELNARPGLAIQIANDAGLVPRLECVRKQKILPVQQRVKFAQAHFK